ncbi:MAG: hypothetical protein K6F35_10780 [Lachnospiraceae bacterium]|nr:hypothetical protein [Lachnospiraceae bacterium]
MKKNWKKVLSLILALSMVLGMNTTAFASDLAYAVSEAEAPAAVAEEAAEPAEAAAAAEEPAEAQSAAEAEVQPEEAPAAEPAGNVDDVEAEAYPTSSTAYKASIGDTPLTVTVSRDGSDTMDLLAIEGESIESGAEILLQFTDSTLSEEFAMSHLINNITVNTDDPYVKIVISGNGAALANKPTAKNAKSDTLKIYQGAMTYAVRDDGATYSPTEIHWNNGYNDNGYAMIFGLNDDTEFASGSFSPEYGYFETKKTAKNAGTYLKYGMDITITTIDGVNKTLNDKKSIWGGGKLYAQEIPTDIYGNAVVEEKDGLALIRSYSWTSETMDDDYGDPYTVTHPTYYQVVRIPKLAEAPYYNKDFTVRVDGSYDSLYDEEKGAGKRYYGTLTLAEPANGCMYGTFEKNSFENFKVDNWSSNGSVKVFTCTDWDNDWDDYANRQYLWTLKKGEKDNGGKYVSTGNYVCSGGWIHFPDNSQMDAIVTAKEGNWDDTTRELLKNGKGLSSDSVYYARLKDENDWSIDGGYLGITADNFSALTVDGAVPKVGSTYGKGVHTIQVTDPAKLAGLVNKRLCQYDKDFTKYYFNNNAGHPDEGGQFTVYASKEDKPSMTAAAKVIPYGAYSDYQEKLFNLSMTVSGSTFDPAEAGYSFNVYYTTSKTDAEKTVSCNADIAGWGSDVKNDVLSYDAGTEVYALIVAYNHYYNRDETTYVASAKTSFTVAKRGIAIGYDGGTVGSSYVGQPVSVTIGDAENKIKITEFISVPENYEYYNNDSVVDTNTKILSSNTCNVDTEGIDINKPGEYTLGLTGYALKDTIAKNFEVKQSTAKYEVIGRYFAKFYAEHDGQLEDLGKYEIDQNWPYHLVSYNTFSISANTKDGLKASTWIRVEEESGETDTTYGKPDAAKLTFDSKKNYSVYAVFEAPNTISTNQNITVTNINPVVYDGRAHKSDQENKRAEESTWKSTVYDLEFNLTDNNRGYDLVPGTDFTITYKNNVNASAKYDANGNVVELYADKPNKRPQVIIKGKGDTYKNLNITIYFTILPRDLGMYINTGIGSNNCESYTAEYELGNVYRQKQDNKEVKYKYSPILWMYYNDAKKTPEGGWTTLTKKVSLKKGKDYKEHLYIRTQTASGKDYWKEAEKANTPGTYLVALEGTGNYCGTCNQIDNTGMSATPVENYFSTWEFEVVPKDAILMSELKYDIKNNNLKKDKDGTVKAKDFGITASFKKDYKKQGYKKKDTVSQDAYVLINNVLPSDNAKNYYVWVKSSDGGKKAENKSDIWSDVNVKVKVQPQTLDKSKFKLQYSASVDGAYADIPKAGLDYHGEGDFVKVVCTDESLKEGTDYEVRTGWTWTGSGWADRCTNELEQKYNRYGGNTYYVVVRGIGMYKSDTASGRYKWSGKNSRHQIQSYKGDIVLSFKRKPMKLADAVKDGFIEFTATDEKVNINGTFPRVRVSENKSDKKTRIAHKNRNLTYNNESFYLAGDGIYSRGASLTASCKNNTKTGTAKISFKANSKDWYTSYTGAYDNLTFKIDPLEVEWIYEETVTHYKKDQKGDKTGWINSGEVFIQYTYDLQYKETGAYKPVIKIFQAAERAEYYDEAKDTTTFYYKELKPGKDYDPLYTKNPSYNKISANTVSGGKASGQFIFATYAYPGGVKTKVSDWAGTAATWGTYKKLVKKVVFTLSESGVKENKNGIPGFEYTGEDRYPKVVKIDVTGKGDASAVSFEMAKCDYTDEDIYPDMPDYNYGTQQLEIRGTRMPVGEGKRTVEFTYKNRGDAYEYKGTGFTKFKVLPFEKKAVILSQP